MILVHLFFLLITKKNINVQINDIVLSAIKIMDLFLEMVQILESRIIPNHQKLIIAIFHGLMEWEKCQNNMFTAKVIQKSVVRETSM